MNAENTQSVNDNSDLDLPEIVWRGVNPFESDHDYIFQALPDRRLHDADWDMIAAAFRDLYEGLAGLAEDRFRMPAIALERLVMRNRAKEPAEDAWSPFVSLCTINIHRAEAAFWHGRARIALAVLIAAESGRSEDYPALSGKMTWVHMVKQRGDVC